MKQDTFEFLTIVDIDLLRVASLRFRTGERSILLLDKLIISLPYLVMIFATMEGLRTVLSSISFGMDDKYDRLVRKHTVLMVLLGNQMQFYLPVMNEFLSINNLAQDHCSSHRIGSLGHRLHVQQQNFRMEYLNNGWTLFVG